jgi:hypothetical protein
MKVFLDDERVAPDDSWARNWWRDKNNVML